MKPLRAPKRPPRRGSTPLLMLGRLPAPSSLEALRRNPDFAGWMFGVITLSPALFDDTIERVNISLPRRVLQRLDALARSAGESRSGYIAQLTLEERPGSARAPETAETDR